MRILISSRWLLFFLLITTCVLLTSAGRKKSSSKNTDRGGSSRDRDRTKTRQPPPPWKLTPPPPRKPTTPPPRKPTTKPPRKLTPPPPRKPTTPPPRKPTTPPPRKLTPPPPPRRPKTPPPPRKLTNPPPRKPTNPPPRKPIPPPKPPAVNPNQGSPNRQPVTSSENGSPNVRQPHSGEAPPLYPGGGVPGANYPRQPGMQSGNYPQQGGVPGANYPRQPGMPGGNYPQQGGVSGANYPRQPGMPGGVNYPQQDSVNYPQQGGVNYPRQPGTFGQPEVGIPGANYPRQTYTYPANTLGSNVWQPQSGRPAPAYMNYGGLPTGSNMYSKPEKKKGLLGSLMSVGSHKSKKNKYFRGGVPGANYPRQLGMPSGNYPQQGGVPGANYPRQPGMPGGVNYPLQGSVNYPQQGGVNYPRQPGTFGQPGVGIPGANYPRQTYTYPTNTMGSNVWQPQSGRPAPAYMNYGGLPTGSNMYSKPEKKKGLLGSLMSVGSHKPKKNKYFGGGVPGANYPRQPGMPSGKYPQQGGVPEANYPRQPGMPGGVNYPQQRSVNYPQQVGVHYPRQPGTFGQPGVGITGANYQRKTYIYPANTLGSNVWQPQSGRPAPAYMNYGGLPTGSNMYSKPEKKKGFIGSLMSVRSHKPKKNKYFGSQPSPYGMGGMGGMGDMGPMGGGFMGKHGSKAAMYTILPYMAMRSRPNFYRPSFGYYPIFWHSPFYHHYYHYGYYGHTHYDIYNKEYVGRCNRPLNPDHGKVVCNSTQGEVYCDVKCEEGYLFPDNTTSKSSKCWHVTGVWKPMKNFPACQPVCNRICLNGGTCIGPNVCGCPPEYRGLQCEFYFLNCDVRKLSKGVQIKWVCTYSKNETKCKVKCKDSLQFATPTEEVYKCSPDGVWTPNFIPECVSPGGNGVEE